MPKCRGCEEYQALLLKIADLLTDEGLERHFYETISEDNKDEKCIEWGEGLNILIVSDRGVGRAKALSEFLRNKTQVTTVNIIKDFLAFNDYIKEAIPDIVIFGATQENENNYEIYKKAKELNPKAFQAMYAARDYYVEMICREYGISCIGNCNNKIIYFIVELMQDYSNHIFREKRKQVIEENKKIEILETKASYFAEIVNFIKRVFITKISK